MANISFAGTAGDDSETRRGDRQKGGRIHVFALGMSCSVFLMLSFTLCLALALIVPDIGLHTPWLQFLPGFVWLSWQSYVLGLAETFAYGWYVALVFGPLYNYFSSRPQR